MRWLLVVVVCVIGSVEGKIKQVAYGIETYKGEKLSSLQGYGVIQLDECKVVDLLEVNGELRAVGSEFGKIRINGHGVMENCIVKKKTIVHGILEATHTKFLDTVVIASEHVMFDGCALDSIIVRDSGKDEVVELKGDTKIDGTIKFESERGVVMKGSDVQLAGKVVGGRVE